MNENNSERDKVLYGGGFVLPTIINYAQASPAIIVFIPSTMRSPAGKREEAFMQKKCDIHSASL